MCADDLIPENLGKVQDSLWNARTKWFNLGLKLGIDEETLKMLKQNYPNEDDCFREMLSQWLKTVNPTWEELLAALTQPSVGCGHVAAKVRQEYMKKPKYKETPLSTTADATSEFHEVKTWPIHTDPPHTFIPLATSPTPTPY